MTGRATGRGKRVSFYVNAKDIMDGRKGHPLLCPIALALRRRLQREWETDIRLCSVKPTIGRIRINNPDGSGSYYWYPSRKVDEFMRMFDTTGEGASTHLTITLYTETLSEYCA